MAGAAFVSRRENWCSKKELEKNIYARMRKEYIADPDFHSGTWKMKMGDGLKCMNRKFNNHSDARTFVSKKANESGPLIAVSVEAKDNKYWYVGGWCSC